MNTLRMRKGMLLAGLVPRVRAEIERRMEEQLSLLLHRDMRNEPEAILEVLAKVRTTTSVSISASANNGITSSTLTVKR